METIKLQAKHIITIFRNEQNGYTVAKFESYDSNEKEFSVTGYFHNLVEDEVYNLYGDYEEHPKYGMQFKVDHYEQVMANDRESLIRYFSSAQFPGIGKTTASAIVETLGDNAIALIQEDAHVLERVETLNEKKRAIIIKGVMAGDTNKDSVMFFSQQGVSVRNIMKIEAVYGEDALKKVKENPYCLVEDIDGIGFATADKLAQQLTFEKDHPYRIKAAILSSIMNICMANGDTYVEREQIIRELDKKLHVVVDDIDAYLAILVQDRLVMMEAERIYHHSQYDAEMGIATFLTHFPYVDALQQQVLQLDQEIKAVEADLHITYEDKQKKAIETFFASSFAILTGGPGTGKTTIVRGIMKLYRKYYPQSIIALCAPTGRAAKRLTELSDEAATTIHSLLKWDLESNTFVKNHDDPIDADLLIIDEFSMVDQWLFYHLLRAAKPISKILLIGDEDQLPSVGPGCVLKDLVSSASFPLIRLEKIFRQSEGSDVVRLAHEIRKGHCETLQDGKDVAFFTSQNYEIKDRILTIVQNAFDKGYEEKDIQILAPMYGGVAGIDALNNALQKMMNPSDAYKKEVKIGYRIFREHDKVLQLKNQPDDEVYNGDIGSIEEIVYAHEDIMKKPRIIVNFDGIYVEYSGEQIYNITHAYCISIHKSQGSEYPIVIMPIVKDYHYMLQKRLIYTGVTRAKRSLVLLGDPLVFQQAIQSVERSIRKSTLLIRLTKS